MKLTDKPLSFGYSVVDSHSSFCSLQKQKPAEAGFYVNQVKLTDKAASFNNTLGISGAEVIVCHRLYLIL
ncbi:hypothetical protein KZ779_14270 [Escherichia coli]|nr:hypothetical protein [Escherichia coli]